MHTDLRVGIYLSIILALFGTILVRPEWARIDGNYFVTILISWSLFNAFLLWNLIKDPSGICPPEAMCFFTGAIVGAFVFYFLGYPVIALCLIPGFVLAASLMRRISHRWQLLCWVPAWIVIGAVSPSVVAIMFLPMSIVLDISMMGAIIGLICGISYTVITGQRLLSVRFNAPTMRGPKE
jgi:hypothetical protein